MLVVSCWFVWGEAFGMMSAEKKEKSGHLQFITNTLNDVNRLHLQLLNNPSETAYTHAYNSVAGLIKDFDNKSNNRYNNDIEACLSAIYTSFMLKLQGKEISEGTEDAIKRFSKFLALLSKKYKEELEVKE